MASSKSRRGSLSIGVTSALAALVVLGSPSRATASPPTAVDLSTYIRVGRFNLPEPTRTTPPAGSLLCQEASAVTYNWDTDTLFIVGDGGTSVVQVSKTGALINSMTLAPGGSPQGTDFYDTEGITYVGGGRFVLIEERYRQLNLFTYVAGSTLTHSGAQTVKLGTTLGNIGLEGACNDPLTGGFVCVKEKDPQGVFQTGADFAAGTATNGSPTTTNSTNLFNPALAGLSDIADVFALSNLPSLGGQPDEGHLLLLSQESGRVVKIDRAGAISSTLSIVADVGNPLSVVDQGFEGVTMDRDGYLYLVNEQGGGDSNHPQLWVYAPSSGVNQAPTAITLANQVTSVLENTSTAVRLKVADVVVADDGIGTNSFGVSGADAAFFEADSTGLYVKAGTPLDYETKSSYSVTVSVDDTTVGATPDASTLYSLAVVDVIDESVTLARVLITEVAPWGSGASNSPYVADWFELTNVGGAAANITGWTVDDDSNGTTKIALTGVTTIAPGQSVIFMETTSDATLATFRSTWFGSHVPAGFTIGKYSGSGIGLSNDADSLNLFDALGARVTGVRFGASTTASPFRTFDNTAGIGGATIPLPPISTLSTVGTNGAWNAVGDPVAARISTGSPGRIANHAPVVNPGSDQPAVEATGSDGATAMLNGVGSFDSDGDFLIYAWGEGSTPLADGIAATVTLSLGAHTLALTATDPYGGMTTRSVLVTVVDTTAPAISGNPDGITVEATSAAGAAVSFTAPTAHDLVDGDVTVDCARASGAVFPVGTTLNDCTATDAHGNSSSSSFRVTVRDTTVPVVTVPSDITVEATSPAGAVVTYSASASDAVGVTSFSCVPASGSTFAIGTTTVDCTATDAAGNTAVRSFRVRVNGAAELLSQLLGQVTGVGPGNSLSAKVTSIQSKLASNDLSGACGALNAFINEVGAQSGKKIPAPVAASLMALANQIRSVLGC